MSTHIIDGKRLAAEMRMRLRTAIEAVALTPHLVIVQVGHNPASTAYVRRKRAAAAEVGVRTTLHHLPEDITEAELLQVIHTSATEPGVDGVLMQLPLPPRLNARRILSAIPMSHDVDGLTAESLGALWVEDGRSILRSFCPCTPMGVLYLLKEMVRHFGEPLRGRRAVVIGRSLLVGRPMAELLLKSDCTVTIAHGQTSNLAALAQQADIIVSAAGQVGLLTPEMVRPDAWIVDVGINYVEGAMTGDAVPALRDHVAQITPVPGGVGPMTVMGLFYNTFKAALLNRGLPLEGLEAVGLEPLVGG